MDLSFIIPTRDRPHHLRSTLDMLARLDAACVGRAELIVLDNASREPFELPESLPNGIEVRGLRFGQNLNTAARNVGAEQARSDWLVMLDDDSSPLDCPLLETLGEIGPDVAAVGGEIFLGDGRRESGGLPEVIVGCGCVVRRDMFLEAGGYDEVFGYYAEEYDLCARLIAMGERVVHTRSIRFEHRKSSIGRDMNEILYRLVRNNGWVLRRYAPVDRRDTLIGEMIARYRTIAGREDATRGFERGMAELERTIDTQPERALSDTQWDRFEGRAAVRETIRRCSPELGNAVRLLGPAHAKGRDIIADELREHGCMICDRPDATPVVGTLSPGPMLDLRESHPDAIMAWGLDDTSAHG